MLTSLRESCLSREVFGLIVVVVVALHGYRATGEDETTRPSSEARMKFVQGILREVEIESTVKTDTRELKFQAKPLLRYNDEPRGVADSMVFRLGIKGRPIAIMTCELYGGGARRFTLCQEFLSISDPRVQVKSQGFTWVPPKADEVVFHKLQSDQIPADSVRTRLSQIKQLSNRFSARESWNGNRMEMRVLPTPIDRYVPSDEPNADGAIFAVVQGVNPEALLLLETDGKTWSYGWARLGAAEIQAKLDDAHVWEVSQSGPGEDATAGYTFLHRNVIVPLALETDDKPKLPEPKAGSEK
jgi:hypothetical protein